MMLREILKDVDFQRMADVVGDSWGDKTADFVPSEKMLDEMTAPQFAELTNEIFNRLPQGKYEVRFTDKPC